MNEIISESKKKKDRRPLILLVAILLGILTPSLLIIKTPSNSVATTDQIVSGVPSQAELTEILSTIETLRAKSTTMAYELLQLRNRLQQFSEEK